MIEPIPTTKDAAAERFTCIAYRCTISGRICAEMHTKAVATKMLRREHCITCEAGAARAELLEIGPPRCRVKGQDGKPCGSEPMRNALVCRKHRAHVSIPPGPNGERVDKFQPKPPAKQREVFRPTGEVRAPKPKAAKPASKPKAPRPAPPPRVVRTPTPCAACGIARFGVGQTAHPSLVEWCGQCLFVARRSLKLRGMETTPEGVAAWMRTPESERPGVPRKCAPCARCGTQRGHITSRHPATAAWCTACICCARSTLRRRGIKSATPEQIAEVMATIQRRTYDDDPMRDVQAAVARALSAGMTMPQILEVLSK